MARYEYHAEKTLPVETTLLEPAFEVVEVVALCVEFAVDEHCLHSVDEVERPLAKGCRLVVVVADFFSFERNSLNVRSCSAPAHWVAVAMWVVCLSSLWVHLRAVVLVVLKPVVLLPVLVVFVFVDSEEVLILLKTCLNCCYSLNN